MADAARLALGAAVLLIGAAAAPIAAQTSNDSFCLRPARQSACRSYGLFEIRARGPLLRTDRTVTSRAVYIQEDGSDEEIITTRQRQELGAAAAWDFGFAVNVSEAWSVGATFSADLIDGESQEGALHFRRWFTDRLAVSLAPGVFRLDDHDALGYHVSARVHAWDLVLDVRYDVLDVQHSVTVYDAAGGVGTITITDPGGLEHGLSVGGGFQSTSGLVASLILLGLASMAGGA